MFSIYIPNFILCSLVDRAKYQMPLFPSSFEPLPFALCMESTSYVFPFRMVFFYLVTTGSIFFTSAYVRIQSISISRNIHVVWRKVLIQ